MSGITMNNHDMRIAMLSNTKMAYELLTNIVKENVAEYKILTNQSEYKNLSWEQLLKIDVQCESYRMLITNYLVVMLGKGRYDKMSIYNDGVQYNRQLIDSFYKQNETELKSLFDARNKVFAHFDNEAYDNLSAIQFGFIRNCLSFIEDVLRSVNE